ncbi:MAG TPA: hypothetical protein VNL37_02275 [Candidatus Polarisedimenticolia bacterium]|nr:hypothetical protein [Candidatus Polarisedimenticolia bacterium]
MALAAAGWALLCAGLGVGSARALEKGTYRTLRGRLEGRTLRLRMDLRASDTPLSANTISLEGVRHGRESSPVLFTQLQTVFVQRVTNQGKTRLGLTVYKSEGEAKYLRGAVPPPYAANPNAAGTVAAYARLGSTSVVLELKAGKNDPKAQLEEAETLLDRLFYMSGEPSREELESFVRRHPYMPLSQLEKLTGLDEETVKGLVEQGRAAGE